MISKSLIDRIHSILLSSCLLNKYKPQLRQHMRPHVAIFLVTCLGLIGSSMGLVNGLLSSFLAKQMNAARLLRYFQSQGLIDSLFSLGATLANFMSRSSWKSKKTKLINSWN